MIALNVCHAPWISERRATMAALRASLGIEVFDADDARGELAPVAYRERHPIGPYFEETTRGKHWVWHQLQLEWAAKQNAEWCFFAQDDARTAPAALFWPTLAAICAGAGERHDVICLHNGHPAARGLFMAGEIGYTTTDGLVGQFWGAKRETIVDLLAWRRDEIVTGATAWEHGEDSLVGLFCLDRGHRIFHPLPTLYDHDLSLDSTNGPAYDAHLYRAPQVCWYDTERATEIAIRWNDPDYWTKPPVHLGRFYENLGTWAPLMFRDKAKAERVDAAYRADACPNAYRRFFHRLTA